MRRLHSRFVHALAVAALSAGLAIVALRAAAPEEGTLARRTRPSPGQGALTQLECRTSSGVSVRTIRPATPFT